jgi:hypothetical protein
MATPTLISFSESGERIPWREAIPRTRKSDADDNANAADDDDDNDESPQDRRESMSGQNDDADADTDADSHSHSHSQPKSEPSTSNSTPSLESLSRGWSSSTTSGSDSPPPATPSTLSTLGLASVHFPSMPSLSLSIAIPSTMPESEYDLASSGTPATASFYSFDSEGVGRGYGSFGLDEEGGEDDDEVDEQRGEEEEEEEDEREVFESPMSYSAGMELPLPELDETADRQISQEAEDVIPNVSRWAAGEERVEKLKPKSKQQKNKQKQKWWQFSKRGGSVPMDMETNYSDIGREAVMVKAKTKAKAKVNTSGMERRGTVPLPAVPAE